MKNITFIVLACIGGFLFSCSLGFAKHEHIVGKYHIIAVDVTEDACLAYDVGNGNYVSLVPSEVVAYAKVVNTYF